MKKNSSLSIPVLLLLAVLLIVCVSSCRKNPIVPPTPKDPRTYTWTIDTLAYPGSYQTSMQSIWGSSPNDVYVVGHNDGGYGKMYHYNGKTWTPVVLYFPDRRGNAAIDLGDIYGFASNDAWAVGERILDNPHPPPNFLDSSLVIHFDGLQWSEVMLPRKRLLERVWGISPNDIWMGGINGTLYHYDGSAVNPDSVPYPIPADADPFYNFVSFAGNSSEGSYALLSTPGGRYYMFSHQSGTWAAVDSFFYYYKTMMWFSPEGTMYITGSGVYRMIGNQWESLGLDAILSLRICGADDNNLFVVGYSSDESGIYGTVYHYNGSDWFEFKQLRLYNGNYWGIWTDGKEVFVVGSNLYSDFPQKTFILHGK